MTHITRLATVLQTLFTDEADKLAKQLGVVKRLRTFTGSSLVQTLVCGFLNQPRGSNDQMAPRAGKCKAPVTKTALDRRYTPELAQLRKRLIERGVELMMMAPRPRALPLLQRFKAVILQDRTVVSRPDELKTEWSGCGGGNGQTAAALKVQVQFDLLSGSLPGLKLGPGKAPDQGTTLTTETLPAGALYLADLGYYDLKRLKDLERRGMSFLSRIQVGTSVFDEEGKPIDLGNWLNPQNGDGVACRIQLGSEQRLGCRLLAVRCPAEVVRTRRQRLNEEARKKGRAISAAQWAACRWTVLVTNVPPEMLTAEEGLIRYGARWQIEMSHPDHPSSGRLYRGSRAA